MDRRQTPEPFLTETQKQVIAQDLESSGFLSWLFSNGDNALWAKRTPEQETANVLSSVVARLIADATADLRAELEVCERASQGDANAHMDAERRVKDLRAKVTDDEALKIDRSMDDHMWGHKISNSPNYWTCDTGCRRNAIRRAVQQMIDGRSGS